MLRAEVELAWKTQAGHRHHVEGLGNEDAVFVTEEHPFFAPLLQSLKKEGVRLRFASIP